MHSLLEYCKRLLLLQKLRYPGRQSVVGDGCKRPWSGSARAGPGCSLSNRASGCCLPHPLLIHENPAPAGEDAIEQCTAIFGGDELGDAVFGLDQLRDRDGVAFFGEQPVRLRQPADDVDDVLPGCGQVALPLDEELIPVFFELGPRRGSVGPLPVRKQDRLLAVSALSVMSNAGLSRICPPAPTRRRLSRSSMNSAGRRLSARGLG